MSTSIKLKLQHKSYVRDPEETELGRKIISEGIRLIDTLGFEHFTFKKLAIEINSTEASIYRYFENKQKLLIYLISWYWAWLDYQINFQTHNVSEPLQQLRIAIRVIASSHLDNVFTAHIDESVLHRIVVAEAAKSYLTKDVDQHNQEGMYLEYKGLCRRLSGFVKALNADYPYPTALISTMIEAAHQQVYFAEHLPALTEVRNTKQDSSRLIGFLESLVLYTVQTFAAARPAKA